VAQEWIVVKCDDGVGTLARVTRDAYDALYSKIGWTEVDESELVAHEERVAAAAVTPVDPIKMSKDELVSLAVSQGVTLDGTETKAQIAEKLGS
jgi:hypothetical protein